MSTSDILNELPRLSSKDLAVIEARLRELMDSGKLLSPFEADICSPPKMHTPRLACSELAKDFIKQVLDRTPDAKV